MNELEEVKNKINNLVNEINKLSSKYSLKLEVDIEETMQLGKNNYTDINIKVYKEL